MDGGQPGTMIVVVGPSGAGKDSLINAARDHFRNDPRVGFVQRVITRAADGETEDHRSVSPEDFAAMKHDGRFAVSWQAHGLHYGIPAETQAELAAGRTLIANGSRGALAGFIDAFASLAVIEVTARPDVIAERLKLRGRETPDEIERRLTRVTHDWQPDCKFAVVDNSGVLGDAQRAFIDAIGRLSSP
ncbi:phosphonate metabolism protein/1,5-bisphosphokinase (PRPP-forming) PhnN [Rhizobium sp. LjRoot254]|uniref:phosphonate metabolism protein/1,5-bisphosphokinase (PRPP-forming) PhnN n=1 Tax=Rhizobium sp. LjRoot254 TaxID=3342297 RepID=UPI003ED14F26